MDLFADHREQKNTQNGAHEGSHKLSVWKVLLVDDDEQMHQITRLALSGFSFEGRKLELISAYSGIEAREICLQHTDLALALVDVVMESEHAGLELVKYIREELNNSLVRIVLRTGQAGQAPEDRVIREYE
ncbi:response regulator, partial [Vibrio brasiliensis]